ncbi:MAG: cation:proton antiporter [Desulfovibrio sp.]|nr:cation:proton antiporter [Desulfovibrio sp.]
MHATLLLDQIIIIFLLSILVTIVCNKLKLPATVGFLITGVLCGPSMLGIVTDLNDINHIAEIGVAMLLFTIGMELSGEALSRLKRPVFLGGSMQLVLTVLVVAVLAVMGGVPYQKGIFWGCLAALSSSAIVLRIMQEKAVTHSPAGRLSLAILVFQDIMVAPMLLCVPLLAGTLELSLTNSLLGIGRLTLVTGGVLLFARFGLDRLMEAVMRTRTREILLLTTLGLCMGMAMLSNILGLSLSLGAFLAGLLLARSQYSMSVISGILPYRDVFMSLFFISVGMMLNVDFFLQHSFFIIFITALFIVLKTLLTLPSVLIQRYPLRTGIVASLALAQAGEFAFVLAASGMKSGLLDMNSYQSFLGVSVLSMMLAPGMIAIAPKVAGFVAKHKGKPYESGSEDTEETPVCVLKDHLIIVGFGISGKHLAHTAKESGIPYTILEMNPETVARYKNKEPIAHGDASQHVVLEHLGVEKARVLAIIISDPAAVRAITVEARHMNPNVFIIARTRFLTEVAPLQQLGANEVIAEEFETSIEVFSRVLAQYLVPIQEIDAFAARIRQENYRMLRRMNATVDTLDAMASRLPDMGVQAMRLADTSPLCGLTLVKSALRKKHGVTVVAIHREGEIHASPDPDTTFAPGDIIYLFGKTDKLFAVKPLFSGGANKLSSSGR